MNRQSFIFYKSYYDCVQKFESEQRLRFYETLFKYVFHGIEPDPKDDVIYALFLAVKKEIDGYDYRYKKNRGGRPSRG